MQGVRGWDGPMLGRERKKFPRGVRWEAVKVRGWMRTGGRWVSEAILKYGSAVSGAGEISSGLGY